jgi:hypothetical protein
MVRTHKGSFPTSILIWTDYLNRNGSNIGARVLLIVVAVLNAFRNSFSFFLLLIVCMGYGVVKPSLGKTMTYVRYLAIAHFVFGLVYAITSLLISPDTASEFARYFLFRKWRTKTIQVLSFFSSYYRWLAL